jgi:hypothetical protein
MVQNLIVALIVIAAFVHACRKYLPASLRRRIVYRLSRDGTRASRLARWLDTEASCGSGCDTCGSCETTAPAGGASTPAGRHADHPSPTGHRTIPIVSRQK